ncbi:helix-turn-helix domain-containing protein [Ralstonia insidiosa]|nr:helix-turn-helix domain-containing protein [Ralstonia insidiosa]
MTTSFALPSWKSYHLLHAAVLPMSEPKKAFGQAMRAVVCGFVSHAAYAHAASVAATQRWASPRLEQRLAEQLAHDINPVSNLLREARDAADFRARWNGFNAGARLGISTHVEPDGRLRRLPALSVRDVGFRAEVIAGCLDLLTSRRPPAMGIHALAQTLGAPASVVDLMDHLQAAPADSLSDCAQALGCAARSLQRALAREYLSFGLVRQALRLVTAGERLRHCDETVTETALAAGFFDAAHLNHAWMQACGLTPSAYSALARTPAAVDPISA